MTGFLHEGVCVGRLAIRGDPQRENRQAGHRERQPQVRRLSAGLGLARGDNAGGQLGSRASSYPVPTPCAPPFFLLLLTVCPSGTKLSKVKPLAVLYDFPGRWGCMFLSQY